MKSIIRLEYQRPKAKHNVDNVPDFYDIQAKDYTYYTSPLSTAIDAALRLALDGYYVRVTCDNHTILCWHENYIKEYYHY